MRRIGEPSHVRCTKRRLLIRADGVFVVDSLQTASTVAFLEFVLVEIEGLDRVGLGLEAPNRRELKGLSRVAPIAAAAAAFRGTVVEQKAVSQAVLRAANGEVEGVLAKPQRLSRAPAYRKVLGLKRGDIPAELQRHRSIGPLADAAHLSVDLAGRFERVHARQRGLDVPFEPLIAEVLADARLFRIVEELVAESERSPSSVKIEWPFDL